MKGYNEVILLGNVGHDPNVKTFDNGDIKCDFTLATSEGGYTKADGTEVPEKTQWHRVVVTRGLAKVVRDYVKKGTQVFVSGKIEYRKYEKDGKELSITEINANTLQLLGGNNVPREEEKPVKTQVNTRNGGQMELDMNGLPF